MSDLNTNSSLGDIQLTVGIYSNFTNFDKYAHYAFKINMPYTINDSEEKRILNIININTNGKVQCFMQDYKDNYKVCILAVIFDEIDEGRNLIIYPRSKEDKSFQIFGKFVNSETIEINEVEVIEKQISEEIFLVQDCEEEGIYIFKENIDKTKAYLFMIIEKDNTEDVIEIYSSTYSYNNNLNIFLNPNTPQIFALGEQSININFIGTDNVLLNIISLSGSGKFHFEDISLEDREYYLNGLNDRLSLTSFTKEKENKISSLKVESLTSNDVQKEGFIFYITYYPSNYIYQIFEGKSNIIHYNMSKNPTYYYAKIRRNLSYYINLNLYEIVPQNNSDVFYDKSLFKIWATVFSEQDVIKAKFDPNFKKEYNSSDSIIGVFDQAFGTLYFSKEEINRIYPENHSLESNEPLYLFFGIERVNNYSSNFSYLDFELNIFSEKKNLGFNTIPEGIYLNGKLTDIGNKKLVYLFQIEKNKPWLRVEYTSNSNLIKFLLSTNPENEQMDDFQNIETTEELGR